MKAGAKVKTDCCIQSLQGHSVSKDLSALTGDLERYALAEQ